MTNQINSPAGILSQPHRSPPGGAPLFPIVGTHFRPPAKQVLQVLPLGTLVQLEAEPDNPYDSDACKIMFNPAALGDLPQDQQERLEFLLTGSGWGLEDLLAQGEPLQLGYVAKSGGKPLEKLKMAGNNAYGNAELWEVLNRAGAAERAAALANFKLTALLDGSPAVEPGT